MKTITIDKRADGVAVLRFDTPDSPVNIISRELFDEFEAILDEVETDPQIRACVLASAKPATFIAGANLKQLLAVQSAQEGEAFSSRGSALLDRIAASRKPFVAAIWGATLGGGLEVALACHYRLAADDPKTELALPEVMLGLLPGGGGTQRLPRLVGLPEALPLLLTGKRLRARRALRLGLVDALTSPGGITETAARAAAMLADGRLPKRRPRRAWVHRLLDTAPGRRIVFRKARSDVARRTRGLYPAPEFILDCVETGLSAGMRSGLDRESLLFGRLTAIRKTKRLIGLFEAMNELKKPGVGAEPRPVKRVAVLGAGFMGAGVAGISLPLAPVTVKDISDEVLARCAKSIQQGLKHRVRSGALRRSDQDRLFAALHLTTDAADLAGAELVIEAVFEDLELKRKILAETEARIAPEAIFASNTSALPITSIAEGARHPERVLGMHYFSPVHRMPLLELVVPEKTAAWAVATARAFGIRQGKTVIVVKDGPGFYTSRILSPYVNEATILLEQGARIEQVDRALLDFGFPVGPLALLDEVGIDVAAHVAENFGALYAHRGLGGGDSLRRMHEAGYSGRKNRKGFYRYDSSGKKSKKKPVDEQVYRFFGGAERKPMDDEEIARRLSLLMVNEAAYCLQDGIIGCPRDGDVGAILGLGFPPFRGGPFRHLDALELQSAVDRMERMKEAHGPRFEPAPLLREMARKGQTFYDD